MAAIERKHPANMLLHVGYQKTGSTWLQRAVFDKGKHGFLPWSAGQSEQRGKYLWQADRLDYSIDAIRDAYLRKLRPDTADACVALSNEGFVGSAIAGGYDSEWNARTLHGLFPHARVLIMVREQRAMLMSIYSQYIRKGGQLKLEKFLNLKADGRMPSFTRNIYQYHKLVGLYRNLFGADRVLVLPYEMIVRDANELVSSLQSFCGIAVSGPAVATERFNEFANPVSLSVMRALNGFRRSNSLNNYSRLHSTTGRHIVEFICGRIRYQPFTVIGKRMLTRRRAYIDQLTKGEYDESNRLLTDLTGLPLASYGYRVAEVPGMLKGRVERPQALAC